jgi:hypothetical protein
MGLTLKVDGFDLSSYFQAFEDTADPANPAYVEPLYAGVPALSEGALGVGEGLHNREMVFPLALKGSPVGVDQVNLLVQTIKSHLYRGAQVELKPEGATNSSFFDLEHGQFQPAWKHAHHRLGRVLGSLHLTCRPYADTGTTRLVASQTGTGVIVIPATGILGDVAADARLEITTGSYPQVTGNVLAWAISAASVNPVFPAASMAGGSGIIFGASGALGSQYFAWPISNTGLLSSPSPFYLPRAQVAGRNRVLAVIDPHLSAAGSLCLNAYDSYRGGPLSGGVGTLPNVGNGAWNLVDLGEWAVASSVLSNPTVGLQLFTSAPSGASSTASPAMRLNSLIVLPLDYGAGIARLGQATDAVIASGVAAVDTDDAQPRTTYVAKGAQAGPGASSALYRGNASVWGADNAAQLRGVTPKLPVTGSPMASGPVSVIVVSGAISNFHGNDIVDVRLSVRERFSFVR